MPHRYGRVRRHHVPPSPTPSAGSDTKHLACAVDFVWVGGRRDEPELVESRLSCTVDGGKKAGRSAVHCPRARSGQVGDVFSDGADFFVPEVLHVLPSGRSRRRQAECRRSGRARALRESVRRWAAPGPTRGASQRRPRPFVAAFGQAGCRLRGNPRPRRRCRSRASSVRPIGRRSSPSPWRTGRGFAWGVRRRRSRVGRAPSSQPRRQAAGRLTSCRGKRFVRR